MENTSTMAKDIVLHEFHGNKIELKVADGYVNATAMTAAHFAATGDRKDCHNWFITKKTKETLEHLSTVTGIPVTDLYYKVQGGNLPTNQGTWIHPRLAVRFGMWLSDDFGLAVEDWVQDWATSKTHPELRELSAHQIKIAKKMKAAGVPVGEIQLRVEGIDCFNDFRESLTECDSGKFGQVRHHMDSISRILYGKSCAQLRKERNPKARATPDVLSKLEQMTRNLALELAKATLDSSNAGNYSECKGIVSATARSITNGIEKQNMFLQMEKSQHYRERFVNADQLNLLN